jgi:chromosome partitioning protein
MLIQADREKIVPYMARKEADMKVIAIFNNKGGTGKSTATINLAHIFGEKRKQKVCVIDCDGQGNTSRFFSAESIATGLETALTGKGTVQEALMKTRYPNIDVIVSTSKMNDCILGFDEKNAVKREDLPNGYEWVLLDLPPAMNAVTKSLLRLSDSVIVPIELGTFSISGVAHVTEFISQQQANFAGCFVSKFDKGNKSDVQLLEVLRENIGNKVFSAVIPYSRVIKNSLNYRLTAYEYMPWVKATKSFAVLASELAEKCCV